MGHTNTIGRKISAPKCGTSGGSAFWANIVARIGLNVTYRTETHFGNDTNYAFFADWNFGNITGMAKAGWLSSGGAANGGQGNYAGAALSGYFIPDLALTAGVEWGQHITGFGCQTCGRTGLNLTALEIAAEFLLSEDYGVS